MLKVTGAPFTGDGYIAFTPLSGEGYTPFVVISAVVEYRIRQTALVVEIDVERPRGENYRLPFEIIIEDVDISRRRRGARTFAKFCRALGFHRCPDDPESLIGRSAAAHMGELGSIPDFAALGGAWKVAA